MKLQRTQQAFTLIELLVVLAIVTSIGGFVAPDVWRSLQRSSEQQQVLAYGHEIQALRRDLYRKGSALVVPENQLVVAPQTSGLPPLPASWSVRSQSALTFLPSGTTTGGSLVLDSPSGRSWQLQMAVLDGRISVDSL